MADIYTKTSLSDSTYTTTGNWVGGSAPSADDNVFFQHGGTLDGSDQSGTELDNITILPTCTGTIGTADTYLQLDQGTTNTLHFAGSGVAYIDLGTAGCSLVRVDRTSNASNGKAGLYLRNVTNAITLLDVRGGVVKLDGGTASDVTTANVASGATLIIDDGATVGTVNNSGGTVIIEGAVTTLYNVSGSTTYNGSDAATLVSIAGGSVTSNTTGTITTATVEGGTLDLTGSRSSRTITTLNLNGGSVRGLDTGHITVTTLNVNVPATLAA